MWCGCGWGGGTLLLPILKLLHASALVYVGRQRRREVTACKCLLLRGERLCVTAVAPTGLIKEEFTTGLKPLALFFLKFSLLSPQTEVKQVWLALHPHNFQNFCAQKIVEITRKKIQQQKQKNLISQALSSKCFFKQKGGRCFTHLCEFKLDHSGIRHVSATTEKTHRNGSCPVAVVLIYKFNLSLPVNKTCFCSPSAGTRCQDETVPRSCGADAGFCRIHR